MTELDWFSVTRLTDILNVSSDAIYKWVKRGKIDEQYYRYVDGVGRGGKELEIMPKGLPKKYFNIFKAHQAKNREVDLSSEEMEMKRINQLKDWHREHLMPYYRLIKKREQFGLKGDSWDQAREAYNEAHPDQDNVTMPSLYKNWRDYRKEGLDGLIPGYGKRQGKTKIREEDFKHYDNLWMTQNQRHSTICREKTLGAAKKAGTVVLHEGEYWMMNEEGELIDTFPHARTFDRQLKDRYSADAITLARKGERGLRQSQGEYFLNRDLTHIAAGEVWVSDHRQLDVQGTSSKRDIKRLVKSLLYDKPHQTEADRDRVEKRVRGAIAANFSKKKGGVRLWCTAWIDFKTGKWLSWYLHEDAPNTDHVLLSFKWAVEKYGIPTEVIIDNGKDYRARDFAGGRTYTVNVDLDKSYTEGLLYSLNILAHFAIPYNARAKIIERQFQYWIELFEKDFSTYTGKNASERPEATVINAKNGRFPKAIDIIEKFDRFIPLANQMQRNGRELDGLSPDVLWGMEFKNKRPLRADAMEYITMRSSKVKQLSGNGFYDPDLDHHYYNAAWMAGYVGEKVFIKRDPEQWNKAIVYRAKDGEELGWASVDLHAPGMARTDEEKAAFQAKKAHQNERGSFRREQLKHLKKVSPEQSQDWLAHYTELQNELIAYEHDLEDYEADKTLEMQNTPYDGITEKLKNLQQRRTGTDDLDEIAPEKKPESTLKKDIWGDNIDDK